MLFDQCEPDPGVFAAHLKLCFNQLRRFPARLKILQGPAFKAQFEISEALGLSHEGVRLLLKSGQVDLVRIAFDLGEENFMVEGIDSDVIDFIFASAIPPAADSRVNTSLSKFLSEPVFEDVPSGEVGQRFQNARFRVSSNRKKSGPAPFREPSLRHLSRTLNYLPSLKRRTVFF